ncbi:MAG: FAD-dependent monooxygenase [Verrucomicrobiota bacterium]
MKPLTIVGAGLAGLTLANVLQRAGVSTILHEAHTLPKHRVCGEFICGKGAASLRRQQLDSIFDGAREHRSIRWFQRDRLVLESALPSPAIGISRFATDSRLAKNFQEAGGQLLENSRFSTKPEAGKIVCSGRQATQSRWVGIKLHSTNLETNADLELHLGAEGYIGLSGVENGLTNVCGLFKIRPGLRCKKESILFRYLETSGLEKLSKRIQASKIDPQSHVGVASMEFSQSSEDSNPAMIQLGDAYSIMPPFTGNGMSVAIESAEIASSFLIEYARDNLSWIEASKAIRTECRKRFRGRLQVAGVFHPWIVQPKRQRLIAALGSANLIPFRLLYRLTH